LQSPPCREDRCRPELREKTLVVLHREISSGRRTDLKIDIAMPKKRGKRQPVIGWGRRGFRNGRSTRGYAMGVNSPFRHFKRSSVERGENNTDGKKKGRKGEKKVVKRGLKALRLLFYLGDDQKRKNKFKKRGAGKGYFGGKEKKALGMKNVTGGT